MKLAIGMQYDYMINRVMHIRHSRTVSGSHGRFLSLSRYSLASLGNGYVLEWRNLIDVALISRDTYLKFIFGG